MPYDPATSEPRWQAAWDEAGTASGHHVTVRALAWMMAGHVRHHLHILRDRYGLAS